MQSNPVTTDVGGWGRAYKKVLTGHVIKVNNQTSFGEQLKY